MNEQIWTIIGYFASALAGTGGGWFFTRNKYKQEVEGAKIDNFDKSLDSYKKMYEDMIANMKEQNDLVIEQNRQLAEQNRELSNEKADLIEEKKELKKEIVDLKGEVAESRKQIMTLTNFVLASAIQRADGNPDTVLSEESIASLKEIMGLKNDAKKEKEQFTKAAPCGKGRL